MPDGYSRRNFLKLSAALLAGGAAIASPGKARAIGYVPPQGGPVTESKGYCPFCQVRCTYTARVQDGKILSVTGDAGNYWTGGAMCPKGMSILELMDSPFRITEPMFHEADGSWRRISYEEAVAMTAERLKAVRDKYGDKGGNRVALTMPLWDCLESEIAALMTLRTVGSVQAMPPGETCVSTASNMLGLMLGVNSGSTQVDELLKAETVVLWGANVNDLYPPYTRWLKAAREHGARILYIDPRRTRTSLWCDRQFRPQPGTDGVLALGAIRWVLEQGAYDEERARFQIEDFENLAPQTEKFTLERVAEVTKLSQEEILSFYQALAESRRTIVWLGGSLSRQTNGITTARTIILLQALRDNLIGEGKGMLTFQSGKPGGGEELVDHFFGENKTPKMNFRRLRMTMEKKNLDVLFLNSSYRRNPDALGVRKAIEKVPFVVHMGFFLDEESEVSTLFIPAAFGPESQGCGYGNENQVAWREKLVQAPGSCVPAWQFYRDVGRRLDPERYPDFKDPEALCRMLQQLVPSWKGLSVERMRASSTVTWPLFEEGAGERTGTVFSEGKLLTPTGKMTVADRVFGGIDRWDYPKGHPAARDGKKEFPLILTQGKQLWHWQQTLTNFARSMAQFSNGRFVQVNPRTAEELGLVQNDKVMLETVKGGLECWVDITENVLPGAVFTPANCCRTTPLAENRSDSICDILPNYWDRISAQHNCTGCRLRKL
ncbi:molybdopterin-dependent oxidoreductase [uncultured Mailhella sp.]|uniref:molybdopterin-containing oxidoreductase family protein n=1 Tax=uncultured Mailhella sp. TaxID=1981031 RepID=UPI00261ABD44|nr:molybdopterin-dependent oxidoreductase [uncultured Mailhella sp.]